MSHGRRSELNHWAAHLADGSRATCFPVTPQNVDHILQSSKLEREQKINHSRHFYIYIDFVNRVEFDFNFCIRYDNVPSVSSLGSRNRSRLSDLDFFSSKISARV